MAARSCSEAFMRTPGVIVADMSVLDIDSRYHANAIFVGEGLKAGGSGGRQTASYPRSQDWSSLSTTSVLHAWRGSGFPTGRMLS